jgi:outer membrane biosynthesis protein TonB
MEYGKIIAITGMPGLYEMVSSKADGAIVRSLDDQATKFVSGRVHQFTHLESIEVYTERENVNLVDVLTAMKTSEEKLPDEKDNKALQAYFQKVYPTLDFDRVYASDMKKMVKWFDVLERNKVEIKLTEQEEEPVAEAVAEEAPEAKKKTDRKEAVKSDKKLKSTKEEEKKPSAKKEEESPKKTKAAKEKEPPKKAAKKAAKKEEPKKAAKKKK